MKRSRSTDEPWGSDGSAGTAARDGTGALLAAASLLAGVMLATVADGEDVAVGTAGSATGRGLGGGTGSADGATTEGPPGPDRPPDA